MNIVLKIAGSRMIIIETAVIQQLCNKSDPQHRPKNDTKYIDILMHLTVPPKKLKMKDARPKNELVLYFSSGNNIKTRY